MNCAITLNGTATVATIVLNAIILEEYWHKCVRVHCDVIYCLVFWQSGPLYSRFRLTLSTLSHTIVFKTE